MSLNVGELNALLTLDDAPFARTLAGADSHVRGVGGSLANLDAANRRHVGSMGRAWSTFQTGVSGTLRMIGTGGAVLAPLATLAGGWALNVAGDMEQTEVAFEGLLGSGAKAQSFLERLRNFASSTPFEFPELSRAARMLLGVGYNARDVIPMMSTLGDTAAALGVGGAEIEGVVRALGQMKGKGRASAEELQQISEQIPGFSAIKAVADDMGVSVAQAFDMIAAGEVPADRAIQAILTGMREFPGASGAMQRQSQTLKGRLSTLWDELKFGVWDALKPMMPEISAAIADATPVIVAGVQWLIGAFGSVVKWVKANWPEIQDVIEDVGDVISDVFEGGKQFVEDLADAFETSEGTILAVLGGITVALGLLALAWMAGPGIIITGIVALIAGFLWAYNNVSLFRSAVQGYFGAIAGFWRTVWDVAVMLKDALVGIWNKSEPVRNILGRIAGITFDGLVGAIGLVVEAVRTLVGWVGDAIEGLSDLLGLNEQLPKAPIALNTGPRSVGEINKMAAAAGAPGHTSPAGAQLVHRSEATSTKVVIVRDWDQALAEVPELVRYEVGAIGRRQQKRDHLYGAR